MYYVYILKCFNNKLYTGCTKNLKDRLNRHKKRQVASTKKILPIKLKFFCCLPDRYKAFEFEKYLKTGSGRAFIKKHLI